MHDIYCGCGGIMTYTESGKEGSGYYCSKCNSAELDKDLNEDKIADQLARRIIK